MRFNGVIGRAELVMIWVTTTATGRSCSACRIRGPRSRSRRRWPAVTADQDQYFGGIIVMDAEATARLGFTDRYTHGSALLHELGHIVGLDHVKVPDQLMYSGKFPTFGLHDFGPGDLEGLRRLGTDAGCLD